MPNPPRHEAIFINYRRKLSAANAKLLSLMLEQRFPGEVFLDDDLQGGEVWNPTIEEKVRKAKVVLALLPPDWVYYPVKLDFVASLEMAVAKRFCQLHQEDGLCHVRKELDIALAGNIPIIPVLLDDAEPPPVDWLPDSLKELFKKYQSAKLHFARPDRAEFQHFFETVAERASLKAVKASADDDDLFHKAVNKAFPLLKEIREANPSAPAPYIGLKPFARADARLFFGRSREIYKWCYKILRQDEPRLLLLDGYSGTGKSSLLQAGIIPRIEEQGWAVAYGRREEDKIEGLSGVFHQLIKKLEQQKTDRALLILDQVEEAITNPIDIKPREMSELAVHLAKAIKRRPLWKFILGFRSEYTARIAKELADVGIKADSDHTLTLYPLDREGIVEAVQSVSHSPDLLEQYPLYFVPENLPHTIADRLAHRAGYHIAPLIQVNMELLWEKGRPGDGDVHITGHDIQHFMDKHEDLLVHYLAKIRETVTEGYADDLTILELLAFYTEEKPTAATRLETEFQQHEKFGRDERLHRLRRELERHYLLSTTGEGDKRAARLTHDVLAEVIANRYTELNIQGREKAENRQFELLLEQLAKQIYQTEYLGAQATLGELMGIGIRREELRPYLFELLFFWNQCRYEKPLREILQWWRDSRLVSEAAGQQLEQLKKAPDRDAVNRWLEALDTGRYNDLQNRYLAPVGSYMVKVDGGSWKRKREGQEIKVDDFYIANVPLTFWKYSLYLVATGQEERLSGKAPNWGVRGDHPVVNVSWYDAVEYCNWLSHLHGLSKVYTIDRRRKDPNNLQEHDKLKWLVTAAPAATGYRLPTEAEWEYAARGGRKRRGYEYVGSDNLDEVGWYDRNTNGSTQPVAKKNPNELGLYDMSGNVWEWCRDWNGGYPAAPQENPQGPEKGERRVVRGGAWLGDRYSCRVAIRGGGVPDDRDISVGCRLARTV